MDKLVLLSILFATIAIPAMGARMANPRRGLVVTLLGLVVSVFVYFLAVFFVYPRLI